MAPKKPIAETAKKSNKFRLVVFEGDFSDGSVSEIAQALTQALRPATPPAVRQLHNGKPAAQLIAPEPEGEEQVEEEEQVIDGEPGEGAEEEPVAAPKVPRVSRPKVFKNPDFVELEWNGTGTPPVSLKEFAIEKAPKSRNRKYLVAAYWLKEHAGRPNVNIDMMYSCFKTAGWSVGFKDWRAPFDNLTYSNHMRKVGVGEFTITTLGEGALQTPEA
jgi:hypothetical protein